MGSLKNKEWIQVKATDLEWIIEYAWNVYQNPLTRYYPIVDQKSDVEGMIKHAFMHSYLWVLKIGDRLGILPLIVDHEREFIQANGGIATKQDFKLFAFEFEQRLKQEFPGYVYYAGYPQSHTEALDYYQSNSYELDDLLQRYEADIDSLSSDDESVDVEILSKTNFEDFKDYHTAQFENQYWTADLIVEYLDRWVVVLQKDIEITGVAGALCYQKNQINHAEIYFIQSNVNIKGILCALISELKKRKVQHILYLAENEFEEELLQSIGFEKLDDYYGFSCIL